MRMKFLIAILSMLLLAAAPVVYGFADDGPGGAWPDKTLYVNSLDVESDVIAQGATQTFSAEVVGFLNGISLGPIPFVLVEIMYSAGGSDYSAGICYTDLNGRCEVEAQFNVPGNYYAYATAMRYGYTPDGDKYPLGVFEVEPTNAPYFTSTPIDLFNIADNNYEYDADAIDPDGDAISYSLIKGPAGMNINSKNGFVTWNNVPTTGSFPVTIRAADIYGAYAEQSYILTVAENVVENHAPTINIPDLTMDVGDMYKINLHNYSYDIDGDDLTYTLISGPDNNIAEAELNSDELELKGISEGITAMTIEVSDGELTDISNFTIKVAKPNLKPAFTSMPLTTAYKNEWYGYEVEADDPEGTKIKFYLLDGPAGMTIENKENDKAEIRWLPSSKGEFDVVIMAVDEDDKFMLQRFTIIVAERGKNSFNANDLIASKIRVSSNEYLNPGEDLVLTMRLENDGNKKLEEVEITASVQELGIRKSTGHFTLKKGDEVSKTLRLEIPEYAMQGNYGLRLEVYNEGVKRIIYRDFFIE